MQLLHFAASSTQLNDANECQAIKTIFGPHAARLAVSPALAGPELTFLRARIAERRGDVAQAATLVTECLQELPGHQGYLDFAVEVSAELPPRARELLSERVRYPSASGS